eukprot:29442-Pelagococcus_subviridis.AAC.5
MKLRFGSRTCLATYTTGFSDKPVATMNAMTTEKKNRRCTAPCPPLYFSQTSYHPVACARNKNTAV